jgi:hypothetical protein
LYWCESSSLTLREESSTAVENRVLRRTLGPKKIVTRGCRKLHNEDLPHLYCTKNYRSDRMMEDGLTGNLKGIDHLRDKGIDGRVTKCGLDSSGSGRVQWRAFLNTVMKLLVP